MITLLEYAKRYLELKEYNQQYWSICPFHAEKTPSFNISNNKFYCFGCKIGGGLISFVMQYHAMTYAQALSEIGEEHKTYNVLNILHQWFKQSITYKEIEYLNNRGLTIDDIYKYELGYVKSSIAQYLLNMNISVEEILSTGLVYQKEGRLIDLLMNRIVFPIYDEGILVSFSGRSDDKPKYINGLETSQFKKSNILHGYSLQNSKYTLIVEGYTDVIALSKINISAYATMGSLSLIQLKKIWNKDQCPIICMDGDEAGHNAMIRIISYALPYISSNYSLKICFIENDPDYMIHNNRAELLMYKIRNAKDIIYILNKFQDKFDISQIKDRNIKYKLKNYKQSKTYYINNILKEDIIIEGLYIYRDLLEKYYEDIAKIDFINYQIINDLINGKNININTNLLKQYNISKEIISDIIIETSMIHSQKRNKIQYIKELNDKFSQETWNIICNKNLAK